VVYIRYLIIYLPILTYRQIGSDSAMLASKAVACLRTFFAVAALIVGRCAGRPASVGAGVPDHSGSVANQKDSLPFQHTIIEVSPGQTAVLQCPSNDEQHRFQFWWMKPDQIIGPGTAPNSDKFKYEVLTGTLYIKVRSAIIFIIYRVNFIL
jgi:hypothetical protein